MENQTIYKTIGRQRLDIAATQIDILNYYDPKNKERRTQELYDVSHEALVENPSETSIREMDKLIRKYSKDITSFRRENPSVENTEEVRIKIRELEHLLSSC